MQCVGNGLKYPFVESNDGKNSAEQAAPTAAASEISIPARVVECFFFGMPHIPRMSIFTGLTTLRIVSKLIIVLQQSLLVDELYIYMDEHYHAYRR